MVVTYQNKNTCCSDDHDNDSDGDSVHSDGGLVDHFANSSLMPDADAEDVVGHVDDAVAILKG